MEGMEDGSSSGMIVLGSGVSCVVLERWRRRADWVTPIECNEGGASVEWIHAMRRITAVMAGLLVGTLSIGLGSAQAEPKSKSVRPSQRGPVSMLLATSTPAPGLEELTTGGRTLYLVPRATLGASKVVSADAITTSSGSDVELILTEQGAEWLSSAIATHKADHLAIMVGGEPLATPQLSLDARAGSLKLVGLNGEQAEQLLRVVNRGAAPAGATFTVVPDRKTIQPGETVKVHVFLSGASQVRSYQVKLAVRGGATGGLLIDRLWIDSERADYVFGKLQKLDAVDASNSRMAGVLLQGAVDVVNPAYVGSYSLRASSDASGVFRANVSLGYSESILLHTSDAPLPFGAGPDAEISVTKPVRPPPSDK